MSNPTSNYGWQMPTATDLVTDLPADFEVFGQAVDTALVDLLGGTTGQVLSKTSATNMDFTWVTPGVGDVTGVTAGTGITVTDPTWPVPTVTNAMATAIDAKGDLIVGTGADAFSRLAVGATNGHVLTVDSAEATGLKYAASAGGANWSLLNSGGTALTAASTITISGISSKDKIMVLLKDVQCVNATQTIGLRLNADTGSNYNYFGSKIIWGTTYNQYNLQDVTALNQSSYIVTGTASDAAAIASASVVITGANSSGVKQISSMGAGASDYGGTNAPAFWLGGFYSGSAVITSVSVKTTSGNFNGGTIYVYTSA